MADSVEQGRAAARTSGTDPEEACPSFFSAPSVLKWVLALLPFGYLWLHLLDNLRLEWTTNPQYGYGSIVPLLALGLGMRRWHSVRQEPHGVGAWTAPAAVSVSWMVYLCALGLAYLPIHLLEESVPEWRPIQWSLAVVTIGLSLCFIYPVNGKRWCGELAFPLCFVLVGVPWPTLVEAPLTQGLTRFVTAVVVDVLGWGGIPAMQLGNVIEVGTGVLGVEEACSGIRSFQSSLMISLFLGEFYRLRLFWRVVLVTSGFLLAVAFNICRTSLLAVVAAKQGVAAISKYHDPAGLSITVACTIAIWAVALFMRRRELRALKQEPHNHGRQTPVDPFLPVRKRQVVAKRWFGFSLFLLAWLILVEVGVQLWYRNIESHAKPAAAWTFKLPEGGRMLKEVSLPERTKYLLRYDQATGGEWKEADGTVWIAYYFNWFPGRVAGYLAKRHTPEICMPAAGCELREGPELMVMDLKGIGLPVRRYLFQTRFGTLHVYHCRWEPGAASRSYVSHESSRFNLIRGIWLGRGKQGQKVIEVLISGIEDANAATQAFRAELPNLIQLEDPGVARY